MYNGLSTKQSPLYLAITLALFTSAGANAFGTKGPEVIRSISLVKKPTQQTPLEKTPKVEEIINALQQKAGDLFNNKIARELNKYAGLFATDTIVNGQTPNLTNNSAPFQSAAQAQGNGHSLRPLPYLDRSLLSFSGLTHKSLSAIKQLDITQLPTGLVGGVATQPSVIEKTKQLKVGVGSDSHGEIDFDYGHQKGQWGHLFQLSHQQVDSYRNAKVSTPNGMKSSEVFIKVAEQGSALRTANQQLTEFSMRYREYDNDESRMGVSLKDAERDPTRRYSATALDNEKTEQLSFELNHDVELVSGEVISTLAYYDDGEASFYQTTEVDGLEGENAATFLSNFEDSPTGTAQVTKDSLTRDYASGGLKVSVNDSFGAHFASLGANYHKETVNDNHFSDVYQLGNDLALQLSSAAINTAKAKTSLTAKSLFVTDHWHNGALSIDVAVKHEKIERKYEVIGSGEAVSESSHTLGHAKVNYQLSDSLGLFISGQEGLLPSTNWLTPSLPQTSQNVRGGLAYQNVATSFSVVAFNNDFYNVFARCYSIDQCANVEDERNDINVRGVEFTANYTVELDGASIPLSFAYTYRDHEYTSELDEANANTQAQAGDELAFLPKNQAFAQVGYQSGQWNLAMRASYRSAQRRYAGIGSLPDAESIKALTLIDLSASYKIDKKQQLFATLNNVTDKNYIESAHNGTNLVGQERSLLIGYRVNF